MQRESTKLPPPIEVDPGQGALFPLPQPPIVIEYARPDGGPLTDEDFDRMQEIARAASWIPAPGKVTIQCR